MLTFTGIQFCFILALVQANNLPLMESNFTFFDYEDFCPINQDFLEFNVDSRILHQGIDNLITDDIQHDAYDLDDPNIDVDIEEIDKASEGAVTLRLYGNTVLGYYYVTLFFGSELQRQNLIVDTGSTITTVSCTGNVEVFCPVNPFPECQEDCGSNHFNHPFDPKKSETNQYFQCDERFGNYICNDCDNKCPFQIVTRLFITKINLKGIY